VTTLADAGARAEERADLRAIASWLLFVAGMVFTMAVIGAITRLTESGLSIVEWQPITGAVPPLNEAQWMAEFEKYQRIPEYQLVNKGMSQEDFKRIYFWEWLHRLWGRLIGLAFLVPLVWFWAKGRIPRPLRPRLAGLFALGGLQGVVGWYMVQSGLADRVDVSHYRLALHLGLAILIYALLIGTALGLLEDRRPHQWTAAPKGLKVHGHIALALLAATIGWGAFVAGQDAGLAAADFPTTNGHWIPPEVGFGGWISLVEEAVAVQWAHRVLAAGTLLAVVAFWVRAKSAEGRVAWAARALLLATLAQFALGIGTVQSQVSIPVAALHQANAMVLVALFVWTLHEMRGPRRG